MTSSTTHTAGESRRRGVRVALGVALLVVLLAGCAASANEAADSANDAGFWLGLYPTWEGVGLQAAAATFVIGSYFLAEHLARREQRVALVGQRA